MTKPNTDNPVMAFLVAVAKEARNPDPPSDESKQTAVACSSSCRSAGAGMGRPRLSACALCGEAFAPSRRSDSRFCCNAHRQAAYRIRKEAS